MYDLKWVWVKIKPPANRQKTKCLWFQLPGPAILGLPYFCPTTSWSASRSLRASLRGVEPSFLAPYRGNRLAPRSIPSSTPSERGNTHNHWKHAPLACRDLGTLLAMWARSTPLLWEHLTRAKRPQPESSGSPFRAKDPRGEDQT